MKDVRGVHRARCLVGRASLAAVVLATAGRADTLVVANKSDATASLIDLETGKVVATLPTGKGPHEVAVSPDGRRALVTNYGTGELPGRSLTLLEIATPRVARTIELAAGSRPHGVDWLDDGRALVTAEGHSALLVVDVEGGQVTAEIATGQDTSHMVVASADGSRAYVANIGSGSVSVIDLDERRLLANVPTGAEAEGIDLAADGTQLWVTNREADRVTVLDTATLATLAELPSASFPIRGRATAAGAVLVTNARSAEIAVFDAAALRETHRFTAGVVPADPSGRLFGGRFGASPVPIGVVVDAAAERAWVAHANADVIAELDLATLEVTRQLTAGREPDGMAWSPIAPGGEP